MSPTEALMRFATALGYQGQEHARQAGYREGFAAGVRAARTVDAAERVDEAGGSRQPYPNE